MNIYLQLAILIFSVFIGGLLVDLLKKQANLKLLLSFSGGFLLTIIFVHILPESYEHVGISTGYLILFGFLLQLLLEYFSKGAEHGHTHVHESHRAFPLVIFISLSVHAFIESIPLLHEGEHGHLNNFYWGIILHKIPVAVALKTILSASGFKGLKGWLFLGVFALMAPAGLLFGSWLNQFSVLNLSWVLAIALGMLIHISTTIIFESSEGHKLNILKLLSILLGFGIGMLMSWT